VKSFKRKEGFVEAVLFTGLVERYATLVEG